ncbi:MAG: ral secretion pathway protein, partial [Ramlibacter sp.]|nr:ral secretion pathway protein [Ramlibacter sp.]
MITSRFALTFVAIAVCRLAAAQGEATVLPGSSLSTGGVPPAGDMALPSQRPKAGPTLTVTPAPAAADTARIMRGTDRVIATPPAPPPLSGAPNTFRFEEAPILDV